MLLIAESGSSKTQWRLIGEGHSYSMETKGINPFFVDKDFVFLELDGCDLRDYRNKVSRIIFYGSGCSSTERNFFLEEIFRAYFLHAGSVKVDHDMMAACLALFGNHKGIACIIGTGSNSCVYDGNQISRNVPALGYILGDEASGTFIGKEILRHYVYQTLPKNILEYISDEYKLDKEDIFDGVYKRPLPNRYLGGFSKIASVFRKEDFIQELLSRGFNEFVKYHIVCYEEAQHYPISAVGSIAVVFQNEFEFALKNFGLRLDKVDQNPIDALVAYYTK